MSDPSLADPIDAILFVSFGGPEGPDEVMPFLERVTAGRGIPAERLQLVAENYYERGGVSPINEQNRVLIAELREALAEVDLDLPIYWGNRNSAPLLDATVAEMTADGIKHAIAFVTSAYSSYSGCRQYRENIAAACASVGHSAPVVEKLRVFFNHPGFIDPLVDAVQAALSNAGDERVHVFFTAHSIPTASAQTCDYEAQLLNAAELVGDRVQSMPSWSMAWQSRSGPPSMPWLEPDICDAIAALDPGDYSHIVVVPIGFVSDHMEVIEDLDTLAAAAADKAGLGFTRVATSSTDPRFVAMMVDLVREKVDGATPVALGDFGLVPTQCGELCCPPAKRPTGAAARATSPTA